MKKPLKPKGKRRVVRDRVAAAVAQGKSVAQAARDAGVSRATASAFVNSDEGQLLVTVLVEAERQKIRDNFSGSLDAIRDALQARKTALDKLGAVVDLGPDHYARLTAVKCQIALLTAGRQPVKPEPKRSTFTIEELEQIPDAWLHAMLDDRRIAADSGEPTH